METQSLSGKRSRKRRLQDPSGLYSAEASPKPVDAFGAGKMPEISKYILNYDPQILPERCPRIAKCEFLFRTIQIQLIPFCISVVQDENSLLGPEDLDEVQTELEIMLNDVMKRLRYLKNKLLPHEIKALKSVCTLIVLCTIKIDFYFILTEE